MKRRLSNEILIHADADRVSRVIADAPRFFRCNPLVIAVDPEPGANGDARAYRVTDGLVVLGATFPFRYRVRTVPVEGGFDAEVWAPLATRLENRLRLLPRDGATLVREEIVISAPGPLALLIARMTATAHREMLVNLKRLAEEGP